MEALRTAQLEPLYASPAEAAKRYGIARSTMYEIMNMPESPRTLKIGKSRLVPIADYDRFIKEYFFNKGERKTC